MEPGSSEPGPDAVTKNDSSPDVLPPDPDAGGSDAGEFVDPVETVKTTKVSKATYDSGSQSFVDNAVTAVDTAFSSITRNITSRKSGRLSDTSAAVFLVDQSQVTTRAHMFEYLNLLKFSRDGCKALPLTVLMWIVLAVTISDRAHTETSFLVRDAVTNHFGNLTARPTRGVAPEYIVSQDEGTGTTCKCACALDFNMACAPPPSLESYRFAGDVTPENLHRLRARSAHLSALRNNPQAALAPPLYLADVHTIPEVWFWIQHGLIPDLWHEEGRDVSVDVSRLFVNSDTSDGGEPTSAEGNNVDTTGARTRGFLLPWTRVIGGIRMRQRRFQVDSCRTDDQITSRYTLTCHSEEPSVAPFGPGQETFADGFIPAETDSEAFDVYLDVDRAEYWALETIEYMLKPHHWLDGDTSSLTLQMVILNAEAKPALFGIVELTFSFDLSGGINQRLVVHTTAADPWAMHYLYLDIAWVFLVLCLYGSMTFKFFRRWSARRNGISKDEPLLTIWDGLEWTAVFASVAVLVNHFVLSVYTTLLADAAAGLHTVPPTGATAEEFTRYHRDWGELVDKVSTHVLWWEYHRLALFGYTIVLTLQFFKIFRGQPKLAHLASALINASEDLIHFLLVFLVLFFNFAFAGFMIFGLVLEQWSTPDRAINSTFRSLMGDTDIMEMYKFAPLSTVIWYSLFAFSMIFLMLNLLVAIIFDHYEIVKDNASAVTGILLQLKFLVNDLVDRSDGSCLRCCCCCCRRSSLPSHERMLKVLADGEGMSDKELRSSQMWVTSSKKATKITAKQVAAHQTHASALQSITGDAVGDLKKICDDPGYVDALKEGCILYQAREYNPQEERLQLMRELVAISEADIQGMKERLVEAGYRTKKTMTKFSRRIDALEEQVHTTLAEVVEVAEHAGVPIGAAEVKSPAKRASLDSTMVSMRSLSNTTRSKTLLSSSMKPVLNELGLPDKKEKIKQARTLGSSVADWHRADDRIDSHHKRSLPPGTSP